MLRLTASAATAIRGFLDRPSLPGTAGLRITSNDEGDDGFVLGAAPEPQAGDQVIEDEGARLFLAPPTVELLDDKVLDAETETGGQVRFVLTPQP